VGGAEASYFGQVCSTGLSKDGTECIMGEPQVGETLSLVLLETDTLSFLSSRDVSHCTSYLFHSLIRLEFLLCSPSLNLSALATYPIPMDVIADLQGGAGHHGWENPMGGPYEQRSIKFG